jgi:hypothetical protein
MVSVKTLLVCCRKFSKKRAREGPEENENKFGHLLPFQHFYFLPVRKVNKVDPGLFNGLVVFHTPFMSTRFGYERIIRKIFKL